MSKPLRVFKYGAVSVAIFENRAQTGNYTFLTANIQRRYQDADGDWQSTTSFTKADIPAARRALQVALEFIEEWEEHQS